MSTKNRNLIKRLNLQSNIVKPCLNHELCNVFCRMVSNFARIAPPISQKLKIDQLTYFEDLSEDKLEAIYELQDKRASPPILALP